MSLFSGLTSKEKLGGVFGMSCYLLLSDRIKNYIPEDFPNKNTPFFMAHGLEDAVVQHRLGEMSSKGVKDLGVEDLVFKSYRYVQYYDVMDYMLTKTVVSDTRLIPMRLTTWRSSSRRPFPPKLLRVCDLTRQSDKATQSSTCF